MGTFSSLASDFRPLDISDTSCCRESASVFAFTAHHRMVLRRIADSSAPARSRSGGIHIGARRCPAHEGGDAEHDGDPQEKGDPCGPNRYPRDEMRDKEDDDGNRPERVEDQVQEEAQYEPAIDARPFHCAVPISSQRARVERARFPLPVSLWYSLPGRKQVPSARIGGWHMSKERDFWHFGHFAKMKGATSNTMLYGRCRAGEPSTRRNGG